MTKTLCEPLKRRFSVYQLKSPVKHKTTEEHQTRHQCHITCIINHGNWLKIENSRTRHTKYFVFLVTLLLNKLQTSLKVIRKQLTITLHFLIQTGIIVRSWPLMFIEKTSLHRFSWPNVRRMYDSCVKVQNNDSTGGGRWK